jgi:RNA polymerase sigma-70 factor (ECF subfamily)
VAGADPLRGLIEKAREGDDHALAELVRRTQPEIWRLCSVLGSSGEEEDLVQETYLRAFRSMRNYRGDSPVRSWLMSIARNVCADHVRLRVRDRKLVDRISFRFVEPVAAGPNLSSDLLDHLDRDRREAFVLTQILDLSYDDAAEILGCPVGTIRSRVYRARADLAAAVERSRRASG